MDERKLEELFRDTVRAVPQATFDENDVVRRSHQVSVRRKRLALGGTVAAAVLAGGVGVGSQLLQPSSDTVASPPPAQQPAAPQPAPRVGGGPSVLQERSTGCAPDTRLIEAVAAELPAAANSRTSAPANCPAGAKGAAFDMHDGPAVGQVTVLVSPIGAVSPQQASPGDVRLPDGAQQSVRKARSGKIVVVVSDPAPTSPGPPFGPHVAPLAGDLAARF